MTPPLPYSYGDTLLKVSGVCVAYDHAPVLRDVNLEVRDLVRPGMQQGQVVALLGPSGMGKTTLFRVLAGLEKPNAGTVLVEKDARPVERGMVGVVAQDYSLFEHRSVLGNLAVAGRQAGQRGGEATERARALLARFGMEEHARKYPAQLSGGQRQRVAIAQQFMCSEHLLLMDEPFSGLDILAVQRVIDLLREMSQTDELKTFVVVTHDIPAALQVADLVWVLGRDRAADGSVIPGARVQAAYNLCERGLAWREDVAETPEFRDLLLEIRALFPKL